MNISVTFGRRPGEPIGHLITAALLGDSIVHHAHCCGHLPRSLYLQRSLPFAQAGQNKAITWHSHQLHPCLPATTRQLGGP